MDLGLRGSHGRRRGRILIGWGIMGASLGMRSDYDPADVSQGMKIAAFSAGCLGAAVIARMCAVKCTEFYHRFIRWP